MHARCEHVCWHTVLAAAAIGNMPCRICPATHNALCWTLCREENACDILVRSNCYCYALSQYVGSYCEPGLGSTGMSLPMPITDCTAARNGLLADGARQVDRSTVYTVPPSGHYIALAVKPPYDQRDTGDCECQAVHSTSTSMPVSMLASETACPLLYTCGHWLHDMHNLA
jgi:hypothetical protein